MNLVLRALTLNDQPLSQAIVGCFDAKGGTIGRSDTNTMTLPDPERHISRLQAEVIAHEGHFVVRNAASANAIFVNGRALGPGERSVLANHDELRVGGYVLGVVIEADNEVVRTITHGRAVVDARAVIVGSAAEHRTDPRQMAQGRDAVRSAAPLSQPPLPPAPRAAAPVAPTAASASNPFADLLGPSAPASPASATSDPFAGLLGTPGAAPAASTSGDPFSFLSKPATPPVRPAASPPSSPSPPLPPHAPKAAPARLPDDFDPFADLAPPPAAGTGSSSPPSHVGANDLLGSVGAGSGTPASIDTSFGLGPVARGAPDPLADFLAAPPGESGKPMAGGGAVSTDPLAMFGPAAAAPPAPPAAHAAFNHTPELNAAYRPPQVAPAAPATPSVDDVFAGLGLETGSSSAAAHADPLAGFLGKPAPSTPATPPSASSPSTPASIDVEIPVTTPAIRRGTVMPTTAATPPRQPAPESPAAAATAVANDALWSAFCEGAGIRIDLPQGLNPEQMRIVGQVLREAAEGALHLMAVRATAKTELRAAVTTIRAKNNNPLKFSPNAQSALEQLLQPPLRGFMAGPLAMRDAMHDLVGHSIGTMAGMRAALAGVLGRFEPAQLERKLVGKNMLDSLLPMNRKAKLWDLYLQHFSAIRDEAQDDFHTLFGAAFVAAYEDQLDRLQPPGGDAGA